MVLSGWRSKRGSLSGLAFDGQRLEVQGIEVIIWGKRLGLVWFRESNGGQVVFDQ